MLQQILYIRLKQTYRYLRAIGWFLLIGCLVISLGVTLPMIQRLLDFSPWQVALGLQFLLIFAHFQRTDLRFLQQITQSRSIFHQVLLLENLLISSPLILLFLIAGQWFHTLFLLLPPLLFLLPIRTNIDTQSTAVKTSVSWLPLRNFELKTYIEQHYIICAILLIISLLGALHFSLFLLGIIFYSSVFISAFTPVESPTLIHWTPHFLGQKIRTNLPWTILPLIPSFILTLVRFPEQWIVVTYALPIPFFTLVLAILYKYAHASPLRRRPTNSTVISVFFLLLLLPGGVLIVGAYLPYLYYKARKNLQYYYA